MLRGVGRMPTDSHRADTASQRADTADPAERRQDVRIIVSIPGYYSLASHLNPRGERKLYACRAVNISTLSIALAAPVCGQVGEFAFATVDHLGKLEGSITRLLNGGFVMGIEGSDEERARFAAKIEWLEQYKNLDVPDQRADRRLIPENPYSRLMFADGATIPCFILDLSASGAAISAQIVPEIGAVLAVGKLVSRVVRHFKGGFAVQFVERKGPTRVAASSKLRPLVRHAAPSATPGT